MLILPINLSFLDNWFIFFYFKLIEFSTFFPLSIISFLAAVVSICVCIIQGKNPLLLFWMNWFYFTDFPRCPLITRTVISEEVMVNHFLPGLRCLHTDMEQLSPEHEVWKHSDVSLKPDCYSWGDFTEYKRKDGCSVLQAPLPYLFLSQFHSVCFMWASGWRMTNDLWYIHSVCRAFIYSYIWTYNAFMPFGHNYRQVL